VEGDDKEECRRIRPVGVEGTIRERYRGTEMYEAGHVMAKGHGT